jgi:hypothetical protein
MKLISIKSHGLYTEVMIEKNGIQYFVARANYSGQDNECFNDSKARAIRKGSKLYKALSDFAEQQIALIV